MLFSVLLLTFFSLAVNGQEMIVALKQRNVEKFEARLLEISDPHHADYQLWLTPDEVAEMLHPSAEEKKAAVLFLRSRCEGKLKIRDLGDALEIVDGKCSSLKRHAFELKEKPFSILVDSHELIDFILFPNPQPVGTKPSVAKRRRAIISPNDPNGYVAAPTINRLYKISSNDATKVSQGIVTLCFDQGSGVVCDAPLLSAAEYFAEESLIPFTNISFYVNSSRLVESFGENEWDLDMQMITQVAQQANLSYFYSNYWMYSVGLLLGEHVGSDTEPTPSVVSISYAWPSSECLDDKYCNQTNVGAYLNRANTEFAKLGSMGITVVTGSGDAGATQDECGKTPVPLFPASSPFVLTAGGTKVVNQLRRSTPKSELPPICQTAEYPCATGTLETPCTRAACTYTTGGGFSDFFPRPKYQEKMVENYLNSGASFPPTFNRSGRAYPDVSCLGDNILIGGPDQTIGLSGGTSAAAPLLAGLISLLNQHLAEQGLPSVGFFNPAFYAMDDTAFTDILIGNNTAGERQSCRGSKIGFFCAKGFDAVSGRGTPLFSSWLKQVESFSRRAKENRERQSR
jgi:hypothetical protein